MRACNCARASPFQSTHPRGVRHDDLPVLPPLRPRFNPRTRVGCDQAPPGPPDRRSRFQSTHPRGVRLVAQGKGHVLGHVSIHAPAWGATKTAAFLFFCLTCFNPRTRVGCDTPARSLRPAESWFQSTHPRGVRRQRRLTSIAHVNRFQSTHPRGVRPRHQATSTDSVIVSIHAPAWGATRQKCE